MRATPCPWHGPKISVFRMRRSRVPCNRAMRSSLFSWVAILPKYSPFRVECQPKPQFRFKVSRSPWICSRPSWLFSLRLLFEIAPIPSRDQPLCRRMRPLPEYAFLGWQIHIRGKRFREIRSHLQGWTEMKNSFRTLLALPIALPVFMGSFFVMNSPAQAGPEIGGQKIVTLTRSAVSKTKPEFTSVTLAPGRGMELIQITANFPGKGSVNVLASPDLTTAKQMLDEKDTANGDLGYRLGSAFLVPYPNRIRGKLSADGKTLTASWEGHTITLPANNIGKLPTAERHAMHGLILKAKTDDVHVKDIPGGQEVTGVIHAGDFGGHWLSKTDLDFTISLTAEAVDSSIVAHNVGSEAEPMAIGWHPDFALPSGDRTQVRIQIPASNLAGVDGYDNVFPTGKLEPVDG